jgi:hypothetical protein
MILGENALYLGLILGWYRMVTGIIAMYKTDFLG